MKLSKRRVPEPPPLTIGNLRFEVELGGRDAGYPHRGGVIAAYDTGSGKRQWALVVYRVSFNPNKEEDTQEVYITDLTAGPRGTLLVTNEEGERFVVDPRDRSIHPAP